MAARVSRCSNGEVNDYDEPEVGGPPVGRRIVLGMLGLGAAGVVVGASVQRQVNRTLAPVRGLEGVLPAAGGGFRFYSVTGGVKKPDPQTFRITVKGMVREPRSFGTRQNAVRLSWPQFAWVGARLSGRIRL